MKNLQDLIVPVEANGIISLTKMWKMVGTPVNKRPHDWTRTQQAAEIIIEIGLELHPKQFKKLKKHPVSGKKQVQDWCKSVYSLAIETGLLQVKPGKDGGTYSPISRIAIAYGSYISGRFHNWALKCAEEKLANLLLPSTYKLIEPISFFCEIVGDPSAAIHALKDVSWQHKLYKLCNQLRGETLPAIMDTLYDLPVFPPIKIDMASQLLAYENRYHWYSRTLAYKYVFSQKLAPVTLASINDWFSLKSPKPNVHQLFFDEAELSLRRWLIIVEAYWQQNSRLRIFPSATVAWVCLEMQEANSSLYSWGILNNSPNLQLKKSYLKDWRNRIKGFKEGFTTETLKVVEPYSIRLSDLLMMEVGEIISHNHQFEKNFYQPFLKAHQKFLNTIEKCKDVQSRCKLPDGTIFTTGKGKKVPK